MRDNHLIIINPQQFGLNTDYVMYAKYLSLHYTKVSYLTIDQGRERVFVPSVRFYYIPLFKFKQLSYAIFYIYVVLFLFTHKGAVMTSNFNGCRWLKFIFYYRKMCVNIRTVSVDNDPCKAREQNKRILKDVVLFDKIIMISKGGAEQLHLPLEKTSIVSLGADILSSEIKIFDFPRLLYVGTLTGRNILQTVQGFHQFIKQNNFALCPTYDIIGEGEEFNDIKHYITINKLFDFVKLHGFIPYDKLSTIIDKCNIGVSYVPITDGFMYQPPTKMFEYINSGLFCIATATQAQKDVISVNNGLVINDTPEDFCLALSTFMQIRNTLDDNEIRKSGLPYLWKNIIDQQLLPALDFNYI